jgi:hypothetical protein
MNRRAAILAIGLMVVTLGGCGRKSEPERPPGADPLAPRRYPVDRSQPPQPNDAPPPEQGPLPTRPVEPPFGQQQQQNSPFLYR